MRVRSTSPLAVTYALREPDLAGEAVAALAGRSDAVAIDGRLDVLEAGTAARTVVCAVKHLEPLQHPAIDPSLVNLLRSQWPSVQAAAIAAIQRRYAADPCFASNPWCREELFRLLAEGSSWTVRRDALQALVHTRDQRLLVAASDPHWRVRHAFVLWCLQRDPNAVEVILESLQRSDHPHVQGVVRFLRWRLNDASSPPPQMESDRPAIWDDDPAVLERLLKTASKADDPVKWPWLPRLAMHEEECVHCRACELLLRYGDWQQLATAAEVLNDLRHPAYAAVTELFARIDRFRCADVIEEILNHAENLPGAIAWGIETRLLERPTSRFRHVLIRRAEARRGAELTIEQLERLWGAADSEVRRLAALALAARPDSPADWWAKGLRDNSPWVRAICANAAAATGETSAVSAMASDPWPEVRSAVAAARISLDQLAQDPHPQVRAAALTSERAAELVANPERETSWRVLDAACRTMRRPLWEIAPDPPWAPPARVVIESPAFELAIPSQPAHQRLLGEARTPVSAIALSGHYRLPSEGFAIGVERGINLFFWEPNYDTLTAFSRGVSIAQRQRLHFIAGTFEATPQAIRRDAERALRVLRIERLELFLLFWTRSWQRLDDAVEHELENLRQRGIVHQAALSTHNRTLAQEAIAEDWNPVMVRHSAAHRGAEQAVFPAATAKGTSLIAFNSTCYGRLLRESPDGTPISAADCYRFTLSHPAVTTCLCAPATLEQLHENLQVLERLELDPLAKERLLRVGEEVYRDDTVFRQTLR